MASIFRRGKVLTTSALLKQVNSGASQNIANGFWEASTLNYYVITCETATVSDTFNNVGLKCNRSLPVATHTVTCSGNNIGLVANRKILIQTNVNVLTGTNSGLRASKRLQVSPISITETANTVGLKTTRKLVSNNAYYSTSYTDTTIRANKRLYVATNSLNATFGDTQTIYNRVLSADVLNIDITMPPQNNIYYHRYMGVNTGEYYGQYQDAPLIYSTYNYFGRIKYYNGSTWQPAKVKQYNGSTWQPAVMRIYDNSQWKLINTNN